MAFLDMLVNDATAIINEQGQTITYTAFGVAGASVTAIWTPSPMTPDPQGARAQVRTGTIQMRKADATTPDVRDTFTISGRTYRVRPSGGRPSDRSPSSIRATDFIVEFEVVDVEAI